MGRRLISIHVSRAAFVRTSGSRSESRGPIETACYFSGSHLSLIDYYSRGKWVTVQRGPFEETGYAIPFVEKELSSEYRPSALERG